MNAALVIAVKDLRQKLRDRSVLLMAVAGPARAGVPVLDDAPQPGDVPHHVRRRRPRRRARSPGGCVDGPLAGLATAGVATSRRSTTEADARAAVDAGDVAAAIVIPAGFTEAVQAGAPAQLLVIGGPSSLSAEIARSVLAGFGSQVTAVQVAVGTALAAAGVRPTRRSPASSRRQPSRRRPRSS